MNLKTFKTREELGLEAGKAGIEAIKTAIAENGEVNIILATGQSQFETLATLVAATDIDWGKVRMFHLDEYIGIPVTHKASFRKYLTERFLNLVAPLKEVVLINGEGDPQAECERLDKKIGAHPIDVAFVGIGENGHLAFNDPPADFDASGAYLVVNLDTQCRQQQLGEGWFASIDEVPAQAISMSIRQIMLSRKIICAVPDRRKAEAVRNCLSGTISNWHPASILRQHTDSTCYLDKESASLL